MSKYFTLLLWLIDKPLIYSVFKVGLNFAI